MKKCIVIAFIFLALLLVATGIFSQEILFNKVFPPEGETFMHVTGIVQDKNGYMWFASKHGLFRFDGYEMKSFKHNPSDPHSLATDSLEAIAVDSSGIIWIATYGGVGLERFDPLTGIFRHFRHDPEHSSSLTSDWVSCVLVDHEGVLWIGTDKGLDRLDRRTGKFIHYRHLQQDPSTISSNHVSAIYEDRAGKLWIGTGVVWDRTKEDQGGLNLMDKNSGKFISYLHDPNDPHTLINNKVRAICEDSKGNFWVGTAGDGLHTMDRKTGIFQRHLYNPAHPEKLSRPPLSKEFETDHITFIKEDCFGAIWIGSSESGINYYDPDKNTITHYGTQHENVGGYEDRTSWWAYCSRDGVLWISTLNGNLYRINRRVLPYYKVPEGAVNSFYENSDGTLWMATDEGLLLHNRNGRKTILLAGKKVFTLKEDRSGLLWIGTQCGLYSYNQVKKSLNKFIFSKTNYRLLREPIFTIHEDSKSNLWIGTLSALYQVNRRTGTLIHYLFFPTNKTWKYTNGILSFLEDRYGKIWVGNFEWAGLQQLDPLTGKFNTFLKGNFIRTLYEDQSGTLWAGTSQGLLRFDRNKRSFTPFIDPSSILENTEVRQIIEDGQRNLWVSTDDLFFKINRERNQCTKFDQNTVLGWLAVRSAYKGHDGKLYFTTYGGYHAFFPDKLTKVIMPPEILISEFHILNHLVLPGKKSPLVESLSSVKTIGLNYRQNIFSFDFASIDFNNPKGNKLHYILENFDRDWNQSSYDRRAVYFKVPPGNYIFRVKSVNKNGLWSERSIAIIITPPWWSMWWFRVLALLIGVAVFYGIIRWRIQRKFHYQLEKSEKDKQLAELRHKTIDLEMQALRAQMNPHFIFNSLNSINRFILHNDKLQASAYLAKFSRLVRLILQNSQVNLISLDSELEALQLYLELEELRFEQHFAFEMKVNDQVDRAAAKVPPLIIQPFVENAIWHGLMHKKEKGHLNIDISEKEDVLYCRITDDGIGRKKASELKNRWGNTHKSMGMRITADRIALLQEQKMNHTSIQVNDLVLPDGGVAGTEVLLKIPAIYD